MSGDGWDWGKDAKGHIKTRPLRGFATAFQTGGDHAACVLRLAWEPPGAIGGQTKSLQVSMSPAIARELAQSLWQSAEAVELDRATKDQLKN